jgi:cathepsin D
VGQTEAIFDTGASQIIGDPNGISRIFARIDGAREAPDVGPGAYTGMLSSATDRPTR